MNRTCSLCGSMLLYCTCRKRLRGAGEPEWARILLATIKRCFPSECIDPSSVIQSAADRIKSLEAELAEAKAEYQTLIHSRADEWEEVSDRIESLEASLALMRQALEAGGLLDFHLTGRLPPLVRLAQIDYREARAQTPPPEPEAEHMEDCMCVRCKAEYDAEFARLLVAVKGPASLVLTTEEETEE